MCFLRPFIRLSRGSADRRFEFLAQRNEEAADQMFRDAGEDALADTRDQAADLAGALVDQARTVLTIGLDVEARGAVAVAERACARYLDAAALRRLLSESDISPSNEPPTAATRNCISTL